jgi:dienelactone hydrolase
MNNNPHRKGPPMKRSLVGSILLAIALVAVATARGQVPVRTEILPIESVTLSEKDFLTGVTTGSAAKIAGELRVPRTNTRAPAVILMHGSSGIRTNAFRWSDELLRLGVAVFIVDSFGGRGISNTGTDQSQLNTVAMTVDAYRALAVLGRHPRIDAERIAVMGFSKGGSVALYSSLRRFQRFHGPGPLVFAAHVAFYPACQRRFIGGEDVTDRPIRIFHGEADDWLPIGPCRDYIERLRRAGRDAVLVAYPGAHHGFDLHLAPPNLWLPNVQRGPTCDLEEQPGGIMVLARTGEPFTFSHPCIVRGATIGYHPEAHRQALADVKSFVRSALRLPP